MAKIPLLLLLVCYAGLQVASLFTDSRDAAALLSLRDHWKNTPPSWNLSNDPCGGNSGKESFALTPGQLSAMGLVGTLSGDIGQLTDLISLDLSFNQGLTGSISAWIGNLQKLNNLVLAGCSFTGILPTELGNLTELYFLILHSNNFTGYIPQSLGNLSKLWWLSLSNNYLTGSLPVSTTTSLGLDLLLNATIFHLEDNQLSGRIPPKLFNSNMALKRLQLGGNHCSGSIPDTLELVQTLQILQLDRNSLTGAVPSSINNLTKLSTLNLANNQLTGPLPNLAGMDLSNLDLSNNSFAPSEAPNWFSTMPSLRTLVMEYGTLQGPVPQKLFSLSWLEEVKVGNNAFNGTLDLGNPTSQRLKLVDLQKNSISSLVLRSGWPNTLIKLNGNPVCTGALSNTSYCQLQQQVSMSYSTIKPNRTWTRFYKTAFTWHEKGYLPVPLLMARPTKV